VRQSAPGAGADHAFPVLFVNFPIAVWLIDGASADGSAA